jgi:hypothetical protein
MQRNCNGSCSDSIRLTLWTGQLGLLGESLEFEVRPLHVLVQCHSVSRQIGLCVSKDLQAVPPPNDSKEKIRACTTSARSHRDLSAQLTLASNRIKRSFRFLSNPPILTRKNALPSFSLEACACTPLPCADGPPRSGGGGGLTSPALGAPNTLGSRKEELLSERGGSAEVGVSGGDEAHPALMLLGDSGSMLRMK